MKKNSTFTRLLVALLAIVMSMSCIGMTAFAADTGRAVEKETIKVRFYYYLDNYVEEELDVPKGATSVPLDTLKELAKEVGEAYSGDPWYIRDEYTLQIKTDKEKNVKYVSARIDFEEETALKKVEVKFLYQDSSYGILRILPQTTYVLVPSTANTITRKDVNSFVGLHGWEFPDKTEQKLETVTYEIVEKDGVESVTVNVKVPSKTVYVDFKIEINGGGSFTSDASRQTIKSDSDGIVKLPTVKADTYHTFTHWKAVGVDESLWIAPKELTQVNVNYIPGYPEGKASRLITLMPVFESAEINITFTNGNSRRGSLSGALNATAKPGDIVTPPIVEPKEGYLFKGWYKGNQKVDRFDYDTLFKLKDSNGKLTLEARYEKPPITVKFNVGKGSWRGEKEYVLHEDEPYGVPYVRPPRGETMTGWYWNDRRIIQNGGTLRYETILRYLRDSKDKTITLKAKYEDVETRSASEVALAGITVFFDAADGYMLDNQGQFRITDEVKTITVPGLMKQTEAPVNDNAQKAMAAPAAAPVEPAKTEEQSKDVKPVEPVAPVVPEGDFLGWMFENDEKQTLFAAGDEITVEQLAQFIGEDEDTIILIPVFGIAGAADAADTAVQDQTATVPAADAQQGATDNTVTSGTDTQNTTDSKSDGALHLDGETGDKLYGDWFNIGG